MSQQVGREGVIGVAGRPFDGAKGIDYAERTTKEADWSRSKGSGMDYRQLRHQWVDSPRPSDIIFGKGHGPNRRAGMAW